MERLALVLVVASVVLVYPFAPWFVLALWTAMFARRVHVPLSRWTGDRPRAAAVLTIAMLALFVVPAGVLVAVLVADAAAFIQHLWSSDQVQEVLRQLVSDHTGRPRAPADLFGIAMAQGDRAWAFAQHVAGGAIRVVIGLVVLVAGTYSVLVDGDRWYAWLERHLPISAPALRRLANAFSETGRGLFVGVAGAGLAQAVVATIVYAALDLPRPISLGLLTFAFSVVPAIGTSIVWVPVAIGLALEGRTGAAAFLLLAGVALIGTIDNVVRPYLTRRGHLQLPTTVVLLAMFGGVVVLGAWGLFIGPLVVRLAKEALSIVREQRSGDLAP